MLFPDADNQCNERTNPSLSMYCYAAYHLFCLVSDPKALVHNLQPIKCISCGPLMTPLVEAEISSHFKK